MKTIEQAILIYVGIQALSCVEAIKSHMWQGIIDSYFDKTGESLTINELKDIACRLAKEI